MKKNIHILLLFVFSLIIQRQGHSQQLPINTNYVLNGYAFNPAVAGSKPHAVASINYRDQWAGFQDAPKTYMVSLHSPVGKQKKTAMGALISSDNAGLLSRTTGYLTFAYHIKVNETYKLGLGVSAGMVQYRIKLYDAKVADTGDDLLTGNILSNNVFDSNGGLYFYSDKLFVGVSTYQYIGNKITWKDSQSNLSQHMYAALGYTFLLSKKISLQPTLLVKFNSPAPVQPELGMRLIYKNNFWIGGSYRTNESASALFGLMIKDKLSIGYSYDIITSKLKTYTTGSHEIMLSYQFIKPKKKLDADEQELNDIDNSIKSKLKKQNEEGPK
ncbi:MAG: putative rane protein [Bacteroidota bacterium]|jgi:type IX secretion system PorP/SprF family membrane protein|nr:putative rane protein [Bacteroidota bacterium]